MLSMDRTSSVFFLICYLGLLVAGTAIENEKLTEKQNIKCSPPFSPVGERCLLIDNTIVGAWDEVRQFCKNLKGDLVNLHDANFLYDITSYLKDKGITQESFWIGAYDMLDEGQWVWSWNNTGVHMGTPLWGIHSGGQEPLGGTLENCGMLNKDYYYYVFDEDCGQAHSAICSAPEPAIKVESQFEHRKNAATNDCPYPFFLIGNACLLVDGLTSKSFAEQQQLCEGLAGHLAKVDDANDFGALADYLKENGVESDLWVGGTDVKEEDNWVWYDGTAVKMGTPFWGESVRGTQEPAGGRLQNCAALIHQDFHFFQDNDCDNAMGFICQYDV